MKSYTPTKDASLGSCDGLSEVSRLEAAGEGRKRGGGREEGKERWGGGKEEEDCGDGSDAVKYMNET